MNILQRSEFKKAYKRLHDNQRSAVNEAIEKVISTPDIGEQKKGNLAKVRVYKFPVLDQIYLIAYVYSGDMLSFWSFGPHENFYRDLKK